MTWESFYFGCFLVGFFFSLLSFVAGFGFLHLPGLHFHASHGSSGGQNSPVNFGTVAAFLAWFGGTGYLLTRYSSLVVAGVLVLAIVAGLVGATIVFWFVAKLLLKHDVELDPADYERVGVLGRVSSPVRAGGTGEIIFSQEGTRQTCGARSENGEALARGTEVIITRYEHGIAYVRRWEEMAEEEVASS